MIDIIVNRPLSGLQKVNAKDFGVSPQNPDNVEAMQRAFDYLAGKENIELFVEKGVYRFTTEKDILFHDAKNAVFNGNGSEFIFFSKTRNYFRIENCDTVVFSNVYIDWDWEGGYRLADLVRVVDAGEDYVDFAHIEVGTPQIRPWLTLNQFDPVSLTPGCEGGREYYGTRSFYDFSKDISVEHIGSNVTRMRSEVPVKPFQKDEVFLLRYEFYGTNAVASHRSCHVTIENVTVWSVPGMAFMILSGTHHYRLANCKVTIRPNTNRRISATADSLHIGNSGGFGIVEGCDFGWAGDDCINIHDNVGLVLEEADKRTIIVQKRLACDIGDTIVMLKPDYTHSGFETTVAAKEEYSDKDWRLTLSGDLPDNGGKNCIFYNKKFNSAHYIFRNNYFHENRARGLLLGSSCGLVENNTIYKCQAQAIVTCVDVQAFWSEGTGVDRLVVRNNRFIKCNVNDWGPAITVRTILPWGESEAEVFTNLEFEGNLFEDMPSAMFKICSAGNVTVRGNTFIAKEPRKTESPMRNAVIVEKSGNVRFIDNTIVHSALQPDELKIITDNADSYILEGTKVTAV